VIVGLLAALATTGSPVVVSSLTTEQLAVQCQGKEKDPASDFCTGYIIGVFDALSAAHQICPMPERASTPEVVATARKYIRTHRKEWSAAPSFVVRNAFGAAFRCRRTGLVKPTWRAGGGAAGGRACPAASAHCRPSRPAGRTRHPR
jgi:hypothetical protein